MGLGLGLGLGLGIGLGLGSPVYANPHPALAWLPGPGSTLDSKREAGCAPPAGAGVEMSRSWNA